MSGIACSFQKVKNFKKNFKFSKFAKLQMALSQLVFNIFRHLKRLVKAEMVYFSNIKIVCLLPRGANTYPVLASMCTRIYVKLISNFKMKLHNLNF